MHADKKFSVMARPQVSLTLRCFALVTAHTSCLQRLFKKEDPGKISVAIHR